MGKTLRICSASISQKLVAQRGSGRRLSQKTATLSPQHCDMVAVIDTFRDVLDGKMLPEKGLQALAATYPNIPTTNNFLRAHAATARVVHGGSTA